MKFGLTTVNSAQGATPEGAVELARVAEESGFESLWTTEHVVVPAGYTSVYPYSRSGRMAGGLEDFDLPDPLIWMAHVSAHTSKIRLGTGVLILPQRNPVVLAKAIATLDVFSGGRVSLGVGSGWLEEEFAALGVPFDDRGDRTDEYIAAMRALWTEDVSSFHGETVRFDEVYLRPKPVQQTVPIIIGGHSRRAARRAGELGDGFFPAGRSDGLAEIVGLAREHAERAGRDPAALEISAAARPTLKDAERLAGLGVDRMITSAIIGLDGISDFGESVIAQMT